MPLSTITSHGDRNGIPLAGPGGENVIAAWPVSRDRLDRPRHEVDFAQRVVFLVSHVERLAVQRHTLGVAELRVGEGAVGEAAFSVADDLLHVAVQVCHDDAMVS